MKELYLEQLTRLAFHITKPFCYSCYREAPTGICSTCGSDDLMRSLPGVGCEYGIDWVISEILREIEPVDIEERFEDSVRSCYPEETKLGWITVDTVSAIKEMDPVSWDLAKSEWLDFEEDDQHIVSFDNGSNYFDVECLQSFLNDKCSDLED